jgi:HKD family nuclease
VNRPVSTAPLDGLYDRLLDDRLAADLASLIQANQASIEALPAEERSARLAEAFIKVLVGILDGVEPDEASTPREQAQMAVIAGLLGLLRKEYRATDIPSWPAPLRALRSIHRQSAPFLPPATGVLRPWLFTTGRADPSLLADLRAELDSADEVDILVSFIKWSGVRKLMDRFEAGGVTGADGVPRRRVRILTTTYMGATEARAVLALARLPGVTVKVSYDTRRTRLHAKAWLFHRATGFGTAFVGSANISNAALIGGLEWTVKFTQAAQADLYVAAQAQFESLWNDPEFERFDPERAADLQRLSDALRKEGEQADTGEAVFFDLTPKAYQAEMLNRLARERELGRTRNLLVAATGTGKTVVAERSTIARSARRKAGSRACYSSRTGSRSCARRWRPTGRRCARRASARCSPRDARRLLSITFSPRSTASALRGCWSASGRTTGIPWSSTNAITFPRSRSTPLRAA